MTYSKADNVPAQYRISARGRLTVTRDGSPYTNTVWSHAERSGLFSDKCLLPSSEKLLSDDLVAELNSGEGSFRWIESATPSSITIRRDLMNGRSRREDFDDDFAEIVGSVLQENLLLNGVVFISDENSVSNGVEKIKVINGVSTVIPGVVVFDDDVCY